MYKNLRRLNWIRSKLRRLPGRAPDEKLITVSWTSSLYFFWVLKKWSTPWSPLQLVPNTSGTFLGSQPTYLRILHMHTCVRICFKKTNNLKWTHKSWVRQSQHPTIWEFRAFTCTAKNQYCHCDIYSRPPSSPAPIWSRPWNNWSCWQLEQIHRNCQGYYLTIEE